MNLNVGRAAACPGGYIPLALLTAVAEQRLSPPAAYLWLVLATLADADVTLTPTNAELQQWLPLSQRQIVRLLHELAAAGFLHKNTETGRRVLHLRLPGMTSVAGVTPMAGVKSMSGVTPVAGATSVSETPPASGMSPVSSPVAVPTHPLPPVDYARLGEIGPAPEPQRELARALWATVLPHLPAAFADTVGVEIAQNSLGQPVLIVAAPDAARARALDDGQGYPALEAALKLVAAPVRVVRFVAWAGAGPA